MRTELVDPLETVPTFERHPLPAERGNTLFPIFVKFEKFEVLIVGGGKVGLEKISAVLRNAPATPVTLVGSSVLPEIRDFVAQYPQVQLQERPFERADLQGKQFVIAATDDPHLNRQVKALAAGRGILTNVADTPDLCDFYLSSVVQKGDLKIAISTNGKSPTIAKRLKETLNDSLPGELNAVLQHMPVIRNRLKGDFASKVHALNKLTASLATDAPAPGLSSIFHEPDIEKIDGRKWRRIATAAMTAFGILLVATIVSAYVPIGNWGSLVASIDASFWGFIAVGFVAQLIDSVLGMGYGVTTQIALMGAGVPVAAVSSSIHTAEMFSAGASGYSHYRFGNVNRRLFRVLLAPGIIGAVAGAALLAWLGDHYASYVKPVLAVYTLLLGVRILSRAFVKKRRNRKVRNLGWLAGAGGFLDSFGGGGWGPLVTSTLLAKGKTPQYVIGSVSLTEFFVTLASALTFFSVIGISHWQIILGLIIGGVAAAPLGARLSGRLPVRVMFKAVGLMVIFWSLRILWKVWF